MRCARLVFLVLGLMACSSFHRSGTTLTDVTLIVPDAVLDIRYATTNNFTHKQVYDVPKCFLVGEAANALKSVQDELKAQGYRIRIFDCYRPLSVQKKFWAIMPDPRYVADPAKGSRHNKGYAIDLSLATLSGRDVEMPTEYDDFTEKAGPDYMPVSSLAAKHRRILRTAMEKNGFTVFATEWWHFDFKGFEGKPNLDIPMNELQNRR